MKITVLFSMVFVCLAAIFPATARADVVWEKINSHEGIALTLRGENVHVLSADPSARNSITHEEFNQRSGKFQPDRSWNDLLPGGETWIDNLPTSALVRKNDEFYFAVAISVGSVIKYNLNLLAGTVPNWSKDLLIDGYGSDLPVGASIDSKGNAYLGASLDSNFLVTKYDHTSGQKLWQKKVDGGSWDWAEGIAVDEKDNVLITGSSMLSSGFYTGLTMKFAPDGQKLWAKKYDQSSGYLHVHPSAMSLDKDGNVYIANRISSEQVHLVKYDELGSQCWTQVYRLPQKAILGSHKELLSISPDGNTIYLAGAYRPDQKKERGVIFLLSFSSSGKGKWVQYYRTLRKSKCDDFPVSLLTDRDGHVFLAGSAKREKGYDYLLLKYNKEGKLLHKEFYNSPAGGDDLLSSAAVDDRDGLYLTGRNNKGGSATVKLRTR